VTFETQNFQAGQDEKFKIIPVNS